MKSLLKAPVRWLWRALRIIRRPVHRKLESFLARTLRDPIIAHVEQSRAAVERGVDPLRRDVELLRHDTDLALNSCIREIARLEMQLESFREAFENAADQGASIPAAPPGPWPSGPDRCPRRVDAADLG